MSPNMDPLDELELDTWGPSGMALDGGYRHPETGKACDLAELMAYYSAESIDELMRWINLYLDGKPYGWPG